PARALSGQGHPLSGRANSAQGRQEEVGRAMLRKMNQFDKRKVRVRRNLARTSAERPRLSVFRSSKHIYAQVIDDAKSSTLVAASTLEKDLKSTLKTGAD